MIAIAIVDDMSSVAESIACMLKVAGMRNTRLYYSAEELLEAMDTGFRPTFVISDFFMPGMNGIELLDAINERYYPVSGIIITGNPEGITTKSHCGKQYPVLCKGRCDFFADLIATMGKSQEKRNCILSPAAEMRLYKKLAVQC